MADIDAMQPHFEAAKSWWWSAAAISAEAAAVASDMGMQVHVLEAASRLLARVAEPEISSFYTRLHKDHGVTL